MGSAADLGMVLTGGNLKPLSANSTKEEQTAALNAIISRLNDMLRSQSYSDESKKRAIIGYQKNGWPAGDFGMKISLPGFDVTTATSTELLFSWDFTTNIQYHYGGDSRYIDATEIARIFTGFAPDDNRPGSWITKTGVDVVTELGG